MKHWFLLLLLIIFFSSPCTYSKEQSEFDTRQCVDLREQGQKLLVANNCREAIKLFQMAYANYPDTALIRNDLAEAFDQLAAQTESTTAATELLEFAVYYAPLNRKYLLELQQSIRKQNLDPAQASVRERLGNAARTRGDVAGAVIEYQAALDADWKKESAGEKLLSLMSVIDRRYPYYYTVLGQAFQATSDNYNARKFFLKALDSSKDELVEHRARALLSSLRDAENHAQVYKCHFR